MAYSFSTAPGEVPPPSQYSTDPSGLYSSNPYPVTEQPRSVVPPGEDGGPVSIRNMTTSDSHFAGRMMVEAFRGKFEHAVGKRNMEAVMKLQAKTYESSNKRFHRIFIACYEGRPAGLVALKTKGDPEEENLGCGDICSSLGCCGGCGFICLGCVIDQDSKRDELYIDHICVDDNFRGRGIGKVLMERAEYEARKTGCSMLTLWVAQDNRAKNLYLRQGFRITQTEDGCLCMYCPTGIRMWQKMEKPVR